MVAGLMMTDSGGLILGRHNAAEAASLKEELVAIHVDAREELLDQPFYAAKRFADRLDEHIADRNFELVTGRIDGELIGYAYGASMAADT
jgi:hypothetical protein